MSDLNAAATPTLDELFLLYGGYRILSLEIPFPFEQRLQP
jgi:hypothetical protein